METFSALLAICAGNSPVSGEFPAQRPVTRSFDVFFDLRLNKRLSKQSWGWWFETLSRPLWRHRNVFDDSPYVLLPEHYCTHNFYVSAPENVISWIPSQVTWERSQPIREDVTCETLSLTGWDRSHVNRFKRWIDFHENMVERCTSPS